MRKLSQKIVAKVKEKQGGHMTIMNLGIIYLLLFAIVIITTVFMIMTLITQSRNQIQEATVSVIQNNYANVYHTSREAYSGGYLPDESSFTASVLLPVGEIYNVLVENMEFDQTTSTILTKVGNTGKTLYQIKDIELDIVNQNLGSGTQNFVAETSYTFVYPVNFLSYTKDFEIRMRVKAKHSGKF